MAFCYYKVIFLRSLIISKLKFFSFFPLQTKNKKLKRKFRASMEKSTEKSVSSVTSGNLILTSFSLRSSIPVSVIAIYIYSDRNRELNQLEAEVSSQICSQIQGREASCSRFLKRLFSAQKVLIIVFAPESPPMK